MKVYVTRSVIAAACILTLCAPQTAAAGQAQDPAQATPAPAPPSQTPAVPDDRAVDPSEPDFTLIGLADDAAHAQVRQRVPRDPSLHALARPGQFRRSARRWLRHRRRRADRAGIPLRAFSAERRSASTARATRRFSSSASSSCFARRGQVPLGLDMIVTIEGRNNFQEIYSPAVGAIISRKLGAHGALYAQPIWIGNTNSFDLVAGDDNDTFIVGVGTRLRIRPEAVPRRRSRTAIRLRPGDRLRQLRHRDAGGRPLVSDQRLGWLRDDHGADGTWRIRQRRLVSRIQHLAKILLRRVPAPESIDLSGGRIVTNTQKWTLAGIVPAFALAIACGGSSNAPSSNPGGGGGSPGPVSATITIGANGAISPTSVTINNGESVRFVEQPQPAAPDDLGSSSDPHRLPADQRAGGHRPRAERPDQRDDDVADVRVPRSSQRHDAASTAIVIR